MSTVLLTENDVVEAVCGFLRSHGYTIVQQLTTAERGPDIVATRQDRPGQTLSIEAKGATSARPFSHVSKAFYRHRPA